MISRKSFKLFASVLREARPSAYDTSARRNQWERDVLAVANACELLNERFERYRFLHEAGLSEETEEKA